jgi:AcrR family transcriptional regulator
MLRADACALLPSQVRSAALHWQISRLLPSRAFPATRPTLGMRCSRQKERREQSSIGQPLLYRYFPSKRSLIERVYRDVFLERWNPQWEVWLSDRSQPLQDRLVRFYQDYTRTIMHRDWIRLFLLSGLENVAINRRYLKMMHKRIWSRVVDEIRFESRRPSIKQLPPSETEIELVWAVIASIFYIGVRRWVFGFGVPKDLDLVIADKIKAFLQGAPAAMAAPAGGRRQARTQVTGL